MIALSTIQGSQSALKTSVGFRAHPDLRRAAAEAAEMARAGLDGATAQLALVLTAGVAGDDPSPAVRDVLGPIGVAGGSTRALLLETGARTEGVLVIAAATEGDAATG